MRHNPTLTLLTLAAMLMVAAPAPAQRAKTQKPAPTRPAATVTVTPSFENAEAKRLFLEASGLASGGKLEEAIRTYEQAIPLCRADGDPVGEAAVLNNIGVAYAEMGRHDSAADAYRKAIPLSSGAKDAPGEATALFNLGVASYELKEPADVIVGYYERALAIFQRLGDSGRQADTLYNLGAVYTWAGKTEQGAEYYRRAKALGRE